MKISAFPRFFLLMVMSFLLMIGSGFAQSNVDDVGKFRNPLNRNEGSDPWLVYYDLSATWWLREGLADSEWISLESYSVPDHYIGRHFGVAALVAESEMTDIMRAEATFIEEK